MKSLQLAIDTISNNLANVNTTGYKKQRVEFKDLFYQRLDSKDNSDGLGAPVNIEVGHGVKTGAMVRRFSNGAFQATDNPFDMALQGIGFFEVQNENGDMMYTKDGSFKMGLTDQGKRLVTSDGYPVQGIDGPINLEGEIEEFKVERNGVINVKFANQEGDAFQQIGQLKLVKIPNPAGLESKGLNLFKVTGASGNPVLADDNSAGEVVQNYLEASNVQVVEEMINLITAQRAYEINSKAIQTSDQMLELANNLRR